MTQTTTEEIRKRLHKGEQIEDILDELEKVEEEEEEPLYTWGI